MNCEQFIDGIFDAEQQELLLREEFEIFTQAVARAQCLELANKTARARSRRRPNYVQELQSVSDLMSGAVTDGVEVGDAEKIRVELTGLQTSTDQILDQIAMQMQMQGSRQSELANQMEMQNSRHDELMTGMRMITDQRLEQVASQMLDMMTIIGSLVNPVVPAPHPEILPGQDQTQRTTSLDSTGNRQSNASHVGGRLGCFECGQMVHFAQDFPRKASVHLNYRGPGQGASLKEVSSRPNYRDYRHRSETG